ncbi:MAG TPA: glycine--tRNA ligase subunit beta, partial [Thermoanaerobaculia bacterium]|nr:glycine--tRNA ligase subunit beta [Thermoanaerobaculia bacterium]
MSEFLLEVLAEEIPAAVLPAARHEILQEMARSLRDERISGRFFVHSTSRRLVVVGKELPDAQEDAVTETVGPPASSAYDAEGHPTRAAEGFARSQGVAVETLTKRSTPKGDYVVARRLVPGRQTADVLADIVPAVLAKMTFPRMMRWGDGTNAWVRPVHSVVALFDGVVVPFTLFGIESGRITTGHRTLAEGRLIIISADGYFVKLRAAHVEPDYAVRRRELAESAEVLASEVGARPGSDPHLLDTWAHLVESPGLVRGAFDAAYLELPDEILVTTMREHQKVLPVRVPDGALTRHFLAVCDQIGDPSGLIARGNEWVVNARFADARFFWEDDAKVRLEDRLPRLGALQFQEKLGDTLSKTTRIRELGDRLAARIGRPDLIDAVDRAGTLLKTDLVTGMVGEFPDLQGVVGGLYARREGEPEDVWQAIYDQYRPDSAEDSVPRGDAGGIVALADRLDTLTGLFGLGLVPTGSKDPYALRRAALGVVKILLDKGWHLDLPIACSDALLLHTGLPKSREETLLELDAFLRERLRFLLERRGFRADEIESVLTTDCHDVVDAAARVAAVHAIRKKEDFAPLATAFKR